MSKDLFHFGARKTRIWPDAQRVERLAEPSVIITDFSDRDIYHSRLRDRILQLEQGSEFRDSIFKAGCGVKVRHPARWSCVEADLVHARAMALFRLVYQSPTAVVDDSWASVYRKGDYCAPHSHTRVIASVLYLLDPGEPPEPDDPVAGRFCFGDPRMRVCCPEQAGRMTRHLMPELLPGTMMIFPAEFIHHVNPYLGTKPRITMSWNIAREPIAGKPGALERPSLA
ncbi:MAG: putative 2OG-Fe(II) oxygenase [Burkholderiales bacterium]